MTGVGTPAVGLSAAGVNLVWSGKSASGALYGFEKG